MFFPLFSIVRASPICFFWAQHAALIISPPIVNISILFIQFTPYYIISGCKGTKNERNTKEKGTKKMLKNLQTTEILINFAT
jgi:hypothetical protein